MIETKRMYIKSFILFFIWYYPSAIRILYKTIMYKVSTIKCVRIQRITIIILSFVLIQLNYLFVLKFMRPLIPFFIWFILFNTQINLSKLLYVTMFEFCVWYSCKHVIDMILRYQSSDIYILPKINEVIINIVFCYVKIVIESLPIKKIINIPNTIHVLAFLIL